MYHLLLDKLVAEEMAEVKRNMAALAAASNAKSQKPNLPKIARILENLLFKNLYLEHYQR